MKSIVGLPTDPRKRTIQRIAATVLDAPGTIIYHHFDGAPMWPPLLCAS